MGFPLKFSIAAAVVIVAALTWSANRQSAIDALEARGLATVTHSPAPAAESSPSGAVDTDEIPEVALKPGDPDAPLPYYRLGRDTYMLFGNIATIDDTNRGWNGNAGFVVTPEGVVVIDALGTPKLGRRLIATIRSVTEQPIRYLVVTHNHPDHAYGAVAFRQLGGVSVVAHEGTLEYLRSSEMEASVQYRRTLLGEDMAGFEAVEPDLLVGGELFSKRTLQLGGRTFDVYNVGRHHSSGDLVVHQVEDGIVWISDLAFNQRTTFMGDGDSGEALIAQAWLEETFADAKLMVPGHGSAQTPPFPMVAATRSYIERLREEMAAAVEDFVPLQEAVERSHFEDWQDVRLYEENHRANANFVYREMELELFR